MSSIMSKLNKLAHDIDPTTDLLMGIVFMMYALFFFFDKNFITEHPILIFLFACILVCASIRNINDYRIKKIIRKYNNIVKFRGGKGK